VPDVLCSEVNQGRDREVTSEHGRRSLLCAGVKQCKVEHIPVMANTLAELVSLPRDGVIVDATVGHGGHSLMLGKSLGPEGVVFGLDFEKKAIRRAHFILEQLDCKVKLVCENFARISEQLSRYDIGKADLVLADLGVCSSQLVDSDIGLSFQKNMPLDMRIDKRLKRTAADIVNTTDEKSLANLIYNYGQDRSSRRIARFIVRERSRRPFRTTSRLASTVCRALGRSPHKSRKHPATRTFQALRIAVNHELENLQRFLQAVPEILKAGGRVAVISYHSLEDRMVKNNFKENQKSGLYKIVTKKPITPSREEISQNPRARSAKLRMAQSK